MDWTLAIVLTVIFFATVVRSAFGFGEALIAVPLLALVLPVEIAVVLAVLVSMTVAVAIVLQDWRQIQFASVWRLVIATMFGIPIGLLVLVMVAEPIVKGILGAVIIAFSTFSLLRRTPLVLHDDRLAWLFGFSGGVLGGAYGMNGPPLVIYGALRRWSPQHFRATMQGYFLPASAVGMVGYGLAGLWVPKVTHYYLLTLPVALVAIVLGRSINRRMNGETFLRFVHLALIAVALALVIQAIW